MSSEDKLEVAKISGFAGLAAAARGLTGRPGCGEDFDDADVFEGAVETEAAPRPVKTCAVCAATNDGDREVCWNCGSSLRRLR